MNKFSFSNKTNAIYNNYSDDSSESDYYEEENEGLICKNLDPALAKIMGIIIEEQKTCDWQPPSKSGLDNSSEIISSKYFTNKNFTKNIDYFQVIKEHVINNQPLSKQQLEYIKKLDNEEKFQLIEIYNNIMDGRQNMQNDTKYK